MKYKTIEYGQVDLISESELLQEIDIEHKDCEIEGDTVINNEKIHIERILCYDHQLDWFVKVEKKTI